MKHILLFLFLVAQAASTFGVSMSTTLAGARVVFPRKNVERTVRIVEGDGGYLDLARSRDGRRLWVRRSWDDGTTDVTNFELHGDGTTAGILQFVDGIVEPMTQEKLKSAPPDYREAVTSDFRHGFDTWFRQHLEAWVVTEDGQRITRPGTGVSYDLVPARRRARRMDAAKLQWMAFVKACPETRSACVYFGNPVDVCGRYYDHTTESTGQQLWIAPKRCAGHW